VIIKEGLANGRLTSRGLPDDSPLNEVSRNRHESIDALALSAILAQSWVDIALSGAATVPQLKSNLMSERASWTKTEAMQTDSMQIIPNDYWQQRSRLAWN